MASRAVVTAGGVVSVYDDRWRSILETLGPLTIQRATEVEFEPTSGQWVATHLATGQVIGRGRNRADVISQEVTWLEGKLQ